MRRYVTKTLLVFAACALTAGSVLSAAPAAQAWANGDTPPVKGLQGPSTDLVSAMDVLVDSAGRTYVLKASSILVFAADWDTGNTPPIETVPTGLGVGSAMAFDAEGRLYVADASGNSVTMYGADWFTGSRSPLKTLAGAATGLNWPNSIAFDSGGSMYVTNADGNSVTVYGNNWTTGNTAPLRTLYGASTLLNNPSGIALDSHDNLYVANRLGRNITSYAAGWASGDTAPTKTAVYSAEPQFTPTAIEFDSVDRMVVAATSQDAVVVYAAGWADGSEPVRVLAGASTALDGPGGLAFDANGRMFVSNYVGWRITVYSSIPTPPGAPTAVRATKGNASATVTWTAPSSDGGAPITSYTVVPNGSASRCTWTTGPLSCTVTGLANGTNYTFTVIATNESGSGSASRPSRGVKPLPPSPTVVSVNPASIKAGTAKRITVNGTGYIAGHMTVSLRTVGRKLDCSSVTVVNAARLTCLAPKLTAGAYAVVVGFTDYPVTAATRPNAVSVTR